MKEDKMEASAEEFASESKNEVSSNTSHHLLSAESIFLEGNRKLREKKSLVPIKNDYEGSSILLHEREDKVVSPDSHNVENILESDKRMLRKRKCRSPTNNVVKEKFHHASPKSEENQGVSLDLSHELNFIENPPGDDKRILRERKGRSKELQMRKLSSKLEYSKEYILETKKHGDKTEYLVKYRNKLINLNPSMKLVDCMLHPRQWGAYSIIHQPKYKSLNKKAKNEDVQKHSTIISKKTEKDLTSHIPNLPYSEENTAPHGSGKVPRYQGNRKLRERKSLGPTTNGTKNVCHYKFDDTNTSNRIKVLSIFDGIGSGFVSLRNLGLVIEDYFASEIDEDAIKVATVQSGGKIKQIGDVTALDNQYLLNLGKIDLLIGGSPCTELSLVNPARRGLYDTESSGMLFFEFVRILQVLKTKNPNILFLFENTAAMTKEVKKAISRYLGCQPVLLDSKKFCPMKRARYFWGNINRMNDFCELPSERKPLGYFLSQNCGRVPLVNCIRTLTTNSNSMCQGPYQQLPVAMNGIEDGLWITEVEKLFGFDEHYTDVGNLSLKKRFTLMGNSWCIPVISYLLRGLKLSFLSIS